MQWRYPHFRWWEYVSSLGVTGTNLYLNFGKVKYRTDNWNDPLPLDSALRDLLRADREKRRQRAATVSDYMWHVTQYFSVAESLIVPLAADKFNTEAAVQMTLINWQVLGTAGLVTRLVHMAAGRSRPSLQGCSDEPGADNPCELRGSSFFSGHTSMSAAGAGLNCAHHLALPFYGDGPQNMIPCAVLTASSITVGALRISSDKHWVSDVLVAHLLGYTVGLGLPWLLHYQYDEKRRPKPLLGRATILPWASREGLGLGISGFL